MSRTRKHPKRRKPFNPVKTFFKVMLSIVMVFVVLAGGACFAYHKVTGEWPFGGDTIAKDADETSMLDALLGRNMKLNVAVFGVDADGTRTDVAFVVHYDSSQESLSLLSIPRDTITEIEVFNPSGTSLGMTDNHINLQYAYGDGKEESCELMKTAVSNLLRGLPIQGYYSMNISGISEVGKLVGDVEIVVPDDSLEEHDPYFKEGATVIINGDNAEEFLRYRDTGKSQSALVRQERQKTYLKALIPKLQEKMQTDSSFVGRLLDDIQPYTVTNMGNDVFAKLLNAAGNSTLETQTVPGEGVEGKYYDEYHVNEDELYRLILSMFYHKI